MISRLRLRYAGWQNQQRISRLAQQVAAHARPDPGQPPVVLFNASTRITGLSQNAAFSILTSWGLRLAGVPVVHFVSHSGMSHCILGTNREDYAAPPPCSACISQSQRLYAGANVHWFEYQADPHLAAALQDLSVDQLSTFEYLIPEDLRTLNVESSTFSVPIPLGRLVLPALRWALRRHHLPDDAATRFLLREYMLSAYSVARDFTAFLDQVKPAAAVIFNGIMYPEAAARWIARQRGLRVITHEVGFQRFSTFFTTGQATAYPLDIPPDFELTPEQDARLDAYLEKRFQGKFTMAGIRFWPEMHGLDEAFLQRAARFRQIVPVFTNVVFDTSQVHANTIFPHMFAWLDQILEIIRAHPETLFIIRAHPDEMRPGTAKQSRESVQAWVQRNGVDVLPNVVFIDSQEYISSYELIQRARFVIVYNSSIGLEASLMGRAVLCGGRARYTQYPIVFFPDSAEGYRRQAEDFLSLDKELGLPGPVEIPAEFQRNARRFIYYQLFRASLPLEDYLQAGPRQGFVELRSFSWRRLLPENSLTMQVLLKGILANHPGEQTFLMPEVQHTP